MIGRTNLTLPNLQMLPTPAKVDSTDQVAAPVKDQNATLKKEGKSEKRPSITPSSHNKNMIKAAAISWLLASAVKPANADLLTLKPAGDPAIGDYLSGILTSTVERNSQEKVHALEVPGTILYPRNLVGEGPDKTMVMSAPNSVSRMLAQPLTGIQAFLKEKNIPYKEISDPVNMADIHYDPKLDLLVIAHTIEKGTSCNKGMLNPRCTDTLEKVITAFGKPRNIVQLLKNPDMSNHLGTARCYDLDIFFHLTTNPDGKKIALIYRPCVVRSSKILDSATKEMSMKSVAKKFTELGIHIVDIGPDDFNRLAANAVSLEPGKIVFSDNVSEELKEKLREHKIESIIPEKSVAYIRQPGVADFGAHCLTVNLPNTDEKTIPVHPPHNQGRSIHHDELFSSNDEMPAQEAVKNGFFQGENLQGVVIGALTAAALTAGAVVAARAASAKDKTGAPQEGTEEGEYFDSLQYQDLPENKLPVAADVKEPDLSLSPQMQSLTSILSPQAKN